MDELISSPDSGREKPRSESMLATVAAVGQSGLRLIFDGQSSASGKYYKCNTSVVFHAGDRVKVTKMSGTYVVDYVVGSPRTS